MLDGHALLLIPILGFTVASGVLDSMAFTYSASVWDEGKLVWREVSKAAATFALGIAMYWGAVRYLRQAGVVTPEIQTLIWFGVTIVGIAVLGGRVAHWPVLDQVIAANVFLSLGWLIVRTSS